MAKFMTDEELAEVMKQAGVISKAGTTQTQEKRLAEQLRGAFAKQMEVRPYGQKIASALSPISAIGQVAGGYLGGMAQKRADQAATQAADAQQQQNQLLSAAILRQGGGGDGGPAPAGGGFQPSPVQNMPVAGEGGVLLPNTGGSPPGPGLGLPAQPKQEGLMTQLSDWLKLGQNYGLR